MPWRSAATAAIDVLQRRGIRSPSTRDYQRLRRDIEILCSCRFQCKNAFWDRERQSYVDMNWQLFNSVFYFKATPDSLQAEMPFGFIRGQFCPAADRAGPEDSSPSDSQHHSSTSFANLPKCLVGLEATRGLKFLEQRLSIYLAKKFMFPKPRDRIEDRFRLLCIFIPWVHG